MEISYFTASNTSCHWCALNISFVASERIQIVFAGRKTNVNLQKENDAFNISTDKAPDKQFPLTFVGFAIQKRRCRKVISALFTAAHLKKT